MSLSKISDIELMNKLVTTSTLEHEATVTFLAYLGEVDARKLFLNEGYSSMFAFMIEKLSYSEYSALTRIQSARCVRRIPKALELLKDKKVTLSSLSLISGILTPENSSQLLNAIEGKSKRQVEEIVAHFKGTETKRIEVIKPIVIRSALQKPKGNCASEGVENNTPNLLMPLPCPGKVTLQPKDESAQVLSFKLSFVVSKDTFQKIERAKSLLSRKFPKGIELSELLDELLDIALKKIDPEKSSGRSPTNNVKSTSQPIAALPKQISKVPAYPANTEKATDAKPKPITRHIPKEVKRNVFKRDGGRCTFHSPDGKRCTCSWNLHYDHIQPFSLGGENSSENLRLLCAAHNQFYASAVFG